MIDSMLETRAEREETLGELLAATARRASDTVLVGQAIAALLTALAIGVWQGPVWELRLSVAVCLFAFALWGIADRDLNESESAPRSTLLALKSVRTVAAVCGFTAAAFLAVALLGRIIGRVIS